MRLYSVLLLFPAATAQAAAVPEVIVVASPLRQAELTTVPASVTVLDTTTIEATSVQHFEELIPLVPNVGWSGGSSRVRYLQVRGTGELEQYEGAPNPSVGFIVDDIDLSGIGGVATTFDVGRVEVLRGPQGTRYGANALAGLVYVETGQPTATPGAALEATGGGDGTWALGGVAHGDVAGRGDELTYRVAVQQYASDGFRHNAFLGRDDTADRDERTARAKLRWQPRAGVSLQLTVFHVDVDNGYDDFNLENTYTTFSDKPGEDAQQTDAAAVRGTVPLGVAADLLSITSVASSDSDYGFDADWGNDDYWSPYVYDYTQRIRRQRDTLSQELRVLSRPEHRVLGADWLAGVYALRLTEDFAQTDTARDDGGSYPPATHSSSYTATNVAAYAELAWPLAATTTFTAGLRREVRAADYDDSAGSRFDPTDRMLGGDLTLTQALAAGAGAPGTTVWARVARGYKAGGFNPGVAGIPEAADRVQFKPEALWNYEVGVRAAALDGRWRASASVFLQQHDDQQLRIPEQFQPGDPSTFLFFTENAEEVGARGLELELAWQPLAPLGLGAALGLLDTEIERFSARPELEGRELAHAPRYTFALHATWRHGDGWFLRADYSGRDGYAIDYCQVADCNDPATSAYQVLDLRAGREWGAWSVAAWCRNVLDEEYAVRGFYFGNEPPDFTPALYTQLGDPRHAGVTLRYEF